MLRLADKDYFHILNLIYLANSCEDIDSFTKRCLPVISRVFNSKVATFHLIKGSLQHVKITDSMGISSNNQRLTKDKDNQITPKERYPGLYSEHFYQQSPLLKAALTSSNVALKIGANISINEWERMDFFNYFIVPQHIYWELFVGLRWRNRLQGMITLWRPREQSDFTEVDMFKAEMLAPHLMLAVHNMFNYSNTIHTENQNNTIETDFKNGFHLSKREMDILRCVISGMSYNEISDKLFISRLTVHTHVKNIYRKIGIRNKVDLGRFLQLTAENVG